MWAAAGIVGVLVGVALIWWSVALGFTFLVLPILICELMLFVALYLLRKGLSPEADARQNQHARQTPPRYPPREQSQHHRRAGDPARA